MTEQSAAVAEQQDTLPGIEPAPVFQLSTITEFNQSEIALADFRLQYQNLVFNVATTSGLEEAKKARMLLRTNRTSLEKRRKELKADILAQGKLIDGEAARITREIEALEEPIDAQIKAREAEVEAARQAKAAAEAERIRTVHGYIDNIRNHGATVTTTAAELSRHIARLQNLTIDQETYQEFSPLAELTKSGAIEQLQTLLSDRQAFDAEQARQADERRQMAEQQAELDRQRRELAEREAALQKATAPAVEAPAPVAELPVAKDPGDDLPWGNEPVVEYEQPITVTTATFIGVDNAVGFPAKTSIVTEEETIISGLMGLVRDFSPFDPDTIPEYQVAAAYLANKGVVL